MSENPGYGVQDPGLRGPGVWKTRGVKNTGSIWWKTKKNDGAWKTRGLVENTESQWKTRGTSEKHGEPLFRLQWIFLIKMRSRKFAVSNCNENQLPWNTFFDHESELIIFWERKPLKCQRAVQWFSFAWGVYFIFRTNLRKFFSSFEKEIMK